MTQQFSASKNIYIISCCRHNNGDVLVICCEGNAGFYEIGVMATPLNCGYSVLGWNYPGYGWSSVCKISLKKSFSKEMLKVRSSSAVASLHFIIFKIGVFLWYHQREVAESSDI